MSTPDLKTRWVKALRSGRYKQTQEYLSDSEPQEGNCCLGVLCRVAHLGPAWRAYTELSEFDGGAALMQRVGMDRDAERHLIHMNDSESRSFAQIADWIEENL